MNTINDEDGSKMREVEFFSNPSSLGLLQYINYIGLPNIDTELHFDSSILDLPDFKIRFYDKNPSFKIKSVHREKLFITIIIYCQIMTDNSKENSKEFEITISDSNVNIGHSNIKFPDKSIKIYGGCFFKSGDGYFHKWVDDTLGDCNALIETTDGEIVKWTSELIKFSPYKK